tara:strand:+ start:2361 stop:3245 length:885 start_codon:yes stop_codon:yes gene_type:complete
MFEIFDKRQKSDLEKQIEIDGIEYTAKKVSEIILRKLPAKEIAYQFTLEEVEAASRGNRTAINFARNSGISPQEYKSSMNHSIPEVDGPDGPQQTLIGICLALSSNTELMVELRIRVDDHIMRFFSFGKYEGQDIFSLREAEVDVLFIVRDNSVIYINNEPDHLFTIDEGGDEILDGSVVNLVFTSQSDSTTIEVFVAFDDFVSYTMSNLLVGSVEWLNHVTKVIFQSYTEDGLQNLFSLTDKYNTQCIHTFKLYRKNKKHFMVNTTQTKAYLISESNILRDSVDEMKSIFWTN